MSTSNRASWHAYETDYLAWYHGLHGRHGVPFDPSLFTRLARDQWQDEPALCAAWQECQMEWPSSELYTYLLPPLERVHAGRIVRSLFLEHPELGTLVVDVLDGDRLAGMEYLDRVMEAATDVPHLRVEHVNEEALARTRNATP